MSVLSMTACTQFVEAFDRLTAIVRERLELEWRSLSGQVVVRILKRNAIEEQRVVVVVSHDARVFPYADRLIKLENGRVVSDTQEHYVEGGVSAP